MAKSKTVFVSGHFNVLHPGHLRLLRFAKDCGDRLIVAVLSDRLAGKVAHLPETLRLEGVQSTLWVDEAFVIDEPVIDVIARLKPDVVVKGKEHEFADNPEADTVASYGGNLLFSSGETFFSSVELIRREIHELDPRTIGLPHDYMSRHNIRSKRLADLLNRFAELRVCVVGDLIVDEYIACQPLGLSQEEPTIVVMPIDSSRFLGGAGIVAAHAAGLGARVDFVSVTGRDATRDFAIQRLAEAHVSAQLLVDDNRPTTLKQRYRSHGKSLLRVSHLHQAAISAELQQQFLEAVTAVLEKSNLLVFSDFNYGCLPQPLVDAIIARGRDLGIVMAADSQSSSQLGDVGRFNGMDMLTPTEHEARLAMRNREDGLVVLAEGLRRQAGARNVLLTLGSEGLLVQTSGGPGDAWVTDRIEALNTAPKDVAGAGDSLLITSALTLAAGGDIWEAACLGSLAAAAQVGRVGNTPLQTNELMQELA